MNIFGYTFYSIYSSLGFFWGFEGAGTVVVADLFFAYHALAICFVLAFQAFIYPKGSNKLSPKTVGFCIFLWLVVAI